MKFFAEQMKCFILELEKYLERKNGCLYPSSFSLSGLPLAKFKPCNVTEHGEEDDRDNIQRFMKAMIHEKHKDSEMQTCHCKIKFIAHSRSVLKA